MPEGRPWDYDEDVAPDEASGGISSDPAEQEAGWALARKILGLNQDRLRSEQEASSNVPFTPDDPASYAEGGLQGQGEALPVAAMALAPLAAPAAAGAIAPYLPRIAGGVSGGMQGYKRGGLPGAVVGAGVGAVMPTAAAAGGALEGYQQGGLPGAALGYIASGGRGGGKLLEAGKAAMGVLAGGSKAAQVAQGAAQVAKAAAATRTPGRVAQLARTAEMPRAVAQAAKAPVNAIVPLKSGEEVAAKILELRKGMSGAQVVQALKQWHGIPIKDGNQMVKMVLGGK